MRRIRVTPSVVSIVQGSTSSSTKQLILVLSWCCSFFSVFQLVLSFCDRTSSIFHATATHNNLVDQERDVIHGNFIAITRNNELKYICVTRHVYRWKRTRCSPIQWTRSTRTLSTRFDVINYADYYRRSRNRGGHATANDIIVACPQYFFEKSVDRFCSTSVNQFNENHSV